MTEVIHIDNGYITQHLILSGELRDGDIAVKDWKGNVGDSIDLYNEDWTKKETLIEDMKVDEKVEIVEQEETADLSEQVLTSFPPYTRTDERMIQLYEIDRESIRSIRAILSGTDTEEDHKTLEALEKQAINLRKELNNTTDVDTDVDTDVVTDVDTDVVTNK